MRYFGLNGITGDQTSWVTHKHYRTYGTVAVYIIDHNCTSTLIQVYL